MARVFRLEGVAIIDDSADEDHLLQFKYIQPSHIF